VTNHTSRVAPRVMPVALRDGVDAWFTGTSDAPPPVIGRAGNLSHHRPHLPSVLAADRAAVGAATGTDAGDWHLMVQVHGAAVGVVDDHTPPGAELREVDALVTTQAGRVLGVAAADCVVILLASELGVAAVHAGRRGVAVGAVRAAVAALPGEDVVAVVGPAIGGCCYEVPAAMQAEICRVVPVAEATTTWGTPSLDLPRAVLDQLAALGVSATRAGGCTRCTDGWFSHRADPGAGRHLGLVVRR
jgi:YfiH family protein